MKHELCTNLCYGKNAFMKFVCFNSFLALWIVIMLRTFDPIPSIPSIITSFNESSYSNNGMLVVYEEIEILSTKIFEGEIYTTITNNVGDTIYTGTEKYKFKRGYQKKRQYFNIFVGNTKYKDTETMFIQRKVSYQPVLSLTRHEFSLYTIKFVPQVMYFYQHTK